MLATVVACFIVGYIVIVFEHPLRLDKTVPALLMGALCWALISVGFHGGSLSVVDTHEHIFSLSPEVIAALKGLFSDGGALTAEGLQSGFEAALHQLQEAGKATETGVHYATEQMHEALEHLHHSHTELTSESVLSAYKEVQDEGFINSLLHHLGKTAEILIFLIGAMTIVEIVDLHRGFDILKGWVKTRSRKKLLWIVGILGFILSAIIDNLTATIVLVTLLRKLIPEKDQRLWYVAMIVVAANAGGAWSPIGDVTTTMLWIGKRVSTLGLIEYLIIPSLVCFIIPFLIASFMKPFQGEITLPEAEATQDERLLSSKTMLFLGLGMIVFVPIFKTITHLPPYVGMMLSLGVVWLVSEYIHPEEDFTEERKAAYSAHKALSRIEMSSILFFLGILMAVAALETVVVGDVGALRSIAERLNAAIPNLDIVVIILGFLSAIIDNVPLVAAGMGMFDVATFPIDDKLWHFMAYCAGTGGSMLIIGSAAGVAAMGMERIDFIWYLKKIAWLAMIGFLAGAGVFLLIESIFNAT